MASLVISAAVNIGVGLAINALFPTPDVEQEGPRLSELGYTSAAYGKFVNIMFGTDRVDGNIIDTQNPVIEERVAQESSQVGKGGGQSVNTTSYTYYFTGRISFLIEGAADLMKLYGDGKLIYDATDTTQFTREGVSVRFEPGGRTQIQDSEEVSRTDRSAAEQPAYRHLTSVKLDNLALADFGNRIPNFTAVIAMSTDASSPKEYLTEEPAGLDVPGSLSGSATNYMAYDPARNRLVALKDSSTGTWTADANTMTVLNVVGAGGFSDPTYGRDGFIYTQTGATNEAPIQQRDGDTGAVIFSIGASGGSLTDDHTVPQFFNGGRLYQLSTTIVGVGDFSTVFHLNTVFGTSNGAVFDADQQNAYHTISIADGLFDDGVLDALGIPDHPNGRFFIFQNDDTTGQYHLVSYTPEFAIGTTGASQIGLTAALVRTFSRGAISSGDDFTGTGSPAGWAVNTATGDLMLSNGSSTILYNPDDDTILAQLDGNSAGFISQNNYYSGSFFAWFEGNAVAANSFLTIVDTRTLEIIDQHFNIVTLTGLDNGVIHEESQVWDDRVSAIYLSTVDSGGTNVANQRVAKIFINRLTKLGVTLSSVAEALCTSYNNLELGGLSAGDYDVSTLTGETVDGYTINRRSSVKGAFKPLRDRFMFDVIQSDWQIKFPIRGGAAVDTIPEERIGEGRTGRSQTDDPPIQEIRTQDLELPMRMNIRYRNSDIDYDIDLEHGKRHRLPNTTMNSSSERTLDIPIVDTPANMKPLAEQWLWTMWHERRGFKTIIPWEFLLLDPTDVVNIGIFNGDTARVRLTEQDVGAGLAMDIVGTAEETFTFTSTIGAGSSLGRPTNNVPSSLPTRMVLLDAPLLDIADLLITPVSNAYVACAGYETFWPGSTVWKSLDDVDYTQTTTANTQAAMAKIITPPPAMGVGNGNYNNRIVSLANGGTMTIVPLNRDDAWVSAASEEAMLNGGNVAAIVYAATNEVQIFQFQNVTDNADNTFTLDTLLLGRLGTEDVAITAPAVGDTIILLADATGAKEDAAVQRQRLALTDLNVATFFKAVTVGQLIEDSTEIIASYTGRDLRPYSTCDTRVVTNVGDDIDITWQRRTRAVGRGEWENFTGDVALNEGIEQYTVSLENAGGIFITKTVNDVRTVNFTLAEIELGGTASDTTVPWPLAGTGTVAGDFEGGTLNTIDLPLTEGNWDALSSNGWYWRNGVSTESPNGEAVDARISPVSADYLTHLRSGSNLTRTIINIIDLVADAGMTASDFPLTSAQASIWFSQPDADDSMTFSIHVMDSDENILSTDVVSNIKANPAQSGVTLGEWVNVGSIYSADDDPWPQRDLEVSLNVDGAAKLAFEITVTKVGVPVTDAHGAFDHLELRLLRPTPTLTINVTQVSDSGLTSPVSSSERLT